MNCSEVSQCVEHRIQLCERQMNSELIFFFILTAQLLLQFILKVIFKIFDTIKYSKCGENLIRFKSIRSDNSSPVDSELKLEKP